MQTQDLTFNDLKREIQELQTHFPKLKVEDLFVLWFLRAFVTEREDVAADSLVGCPNDKGVDAILIDDDARAVFIVQGKYHKKLCDKNEERSEVLAFADLASVMESMEEEEFNKYLSKTDLAVADGLRTARKKVRKDKYRAWLYFVTTGKVSPTNRKDAEQKVRLHARRTAMEVIDGKRVMLLFQDYLDGVAPPIPALDLEVESGSGVTVSGVAQRFDHHAKIESWVISMKGSAVADLYERAGLRLFARNIRGFMGPETPVNRDMLETLQKEPERFFYYNNGITIVCDQAERKIAQGHDILRVGNPQIINGQQTTRTLAAHSDKAAKASVLVKVIQVPRDADGDTSTFEGLVSRIVAGTNWQNAIRHSDLMSNDRRQIELEKNLRKIGYLYLRKRQSKAEAKKMVGHSSLYSVSKEDLAKAVAGCDLDPYDIRSGLENLFKEGKYDAVFPNSDPYYFVPRYRMMKEVNHCSKGNPERGYAKWMVLNFIWAKASPQFRNKLKTRAFCRLCEKQGNAVVFSLRQAITEVFQEAAKYYRANCGTGETKLDPSQFYKNKKNHHVNFAKFWEDAPESRKRKVENLLGIMRKNVESFED